MEIFKQGSRGQKMLSSDYFYGVVFQDPIIVAPEPSRVRAVIRTNSFCFNWSWCYRS